LTADGLNAVLKILGIGLDGDVPASLSHVQMISTIRAVPILRHLSEHQAELVAHAMVLQRVLKGAQVVVQGEVGTSFFVIAKGEVRVLIDGVQVRTLGTNSYFGERSLLCDEARSASVEVSSPTAELWALDKESFSEIVKGKMHQQLLHRIELQNTKVTKDDLDTLRTIGHGTVGVVKMVKHKQTGVRYALKCIKKTPETAPMIEEERALLKENDHPFIIQMVQSFENDLYAEFLMELVTGGELFDAIRQLPDSLNRKQSQFYAGSILLALESLHTRDICYRDLKPENVMLDAQGYLKLIDFGCAKKVAQRTFTLLGTPHYMAPEVIAGKGYATEVDLWSLGVIVYEFMCRVLPFGNDLDDPVEVCEAVMTTPLRMPSSLKDDDARQLMKGLLDRKPTRRLGCRLRGYEELKRHQFWRQTRSFPDKKPKAENIFDSLMGRQLEPPYVPKGERYCDDQHPTGGPA
jgi:cGMP-dependent protein kinase